MDYFEVQGIGPCHGHALTLSIYGQSIEAEIRGPRGGTHGMIRIEYARLMEVLEKMKGVDICFTE
jgi:hypothetical protein